MKSHPLFQSIICGYSIGCGHSSHWNGWSCGLNTGRGRIVWTVLNFLRDLTRKPEQARWFLSDLLMRSAMRLRRQKVSVFGWYDHARGNEVARLIDRIDSQCVIIGVGSDDLDRLQEIRDALEELSSITGAAWARNDIPQ